MGGSPSSDWRQSGFSAPAGAPLIASLTLGLHDVSTDVVCLATHTEVVQTHHARLNAQDLVGVLVGKGGVLLAELQQLTGVHVQLSDRSQYVIGMPQHRTLTLTGTPEAIGCVQTPHACVGHACNSCALDVLLQHAQVRTMDDVAAALQCLQHGQRSASVAVPCHS